MPDTLRVAPAARDAMVAHAREGAPAEVVGVLAGTRDPDRATGIERASNAADTPETRYALDPAEQVDLLDRIEGRGDEVVGFYHSHPRGPPAPSATDEARATWTGYVYAIVSLAGDPSLDAWRWTGDRFAPLAVRVDESDGVSGNKV
jgi:proteasome lid subunit RPN8/RPN11